VLQVSGQVQIDIHTAESAFATIMDKGFNQLNQTEQNTITTLQTVLHDLNSNSVDLLKAASTSATLLLNQIPFTNKNPEVTSYTPVFTAPPTDNTPGQLTIGGNFVRAFEKNLTPTLTGPGITSPEMPSKEKITTEFSFGIPAAALVGSATKFTPVTYTLTTPYEAGVIFKAIVPGTFNLLITVLPLRRSRALFFTTSSRRPTRQSSRRSK
jgi:hypothetical protein